MFQNGYNGNQATADRTGGVGGGAPRNLKVQNL